MTIKNLEIIHRLLQDAADQAEAQAVKTRKKYSDVERAAEKDLDNAKAYSTEIDKTREAWDAARRRYDDLFYALDEFEKKGWS